MHPNDCENAIDSAVGRYLDFRRDRLARRSMEKLRKFRNKVLAHALLGPALQAVPKFDDLFLLVDVARDVTTHAKLAILGINHDLKDYEDEQWRIAKAFWGPALTAAVASP